MSRRAFLYTVLCGLLLGSCLAGISRSDTIVLKNGRRIHVSNAVRDNGEVSGDTPAGQVAVPESAVASIEKDDQGTASLEPAPPANNSNAQAANLSMGPPAVSAPGDSDPAAHAVVHDGQIDREALDRFDDAAGTGNADAIARAVAAESAASQFEYNHGNFEPALAHAERALSFAPNQSTLLLNAAYLHLRSSEFSAASGLLDRARRIAPDSPDVAKLSGWADYGLDRLPQAVEEWKHAQQLRPDEAVASALRRAEQDATVESNFEEGQSAHFMLRYDGTAAPELARAVLTDLENDFDATTSLLNYKPPEPISVVLYTNQDFADITRAPAWVGAINDGRIRVPVQGLTTVTPDLAHVLRHELAHSFVTQKTHGNCAIWLQEGIAQWAEGKTARDDAANLLALYDNHDDPSMAALEKSWMGLPADYARITYAWSLATVEAIVANGTSVDLNRLLDALASGSSTQTAVGSVLHLSYSDLNRSTADYLRRTYQH